MLSNYRKILELVLAGRSYSEIVEVAGCSRRDVSRVKKVIDERGVTAATVVSEEDLALWFPDGRRMVSVAYEQPDLAAVLAGMKAQRHFTLLMAWRRYADTTTPGTTAGRAGAKKYGYAQFCALFADYVRRNDLVATLHHEPGRAMLVDWAGDTLDLVDTASGEVARAVLFVAVLPYLGALFCRAYLDMKSPAWLMPTSVRSRSSAASPRSWSRTIRRPRPTCGPGARLSGSSTRATSSWPTTIDARSCRPAPGSPATRPPPRTPSTWSTSE